MVCGGIEALRNESYTRLRMERDSLRSQTDEFVTEIEAMEAQLRALQASELESTQVRQRHVKLVSALVASIVYVVILLQARPYREPATAAVALGANVTLTFIFLTAMLLQVAIGMHAPVHLGMRFHRHAPIDMHF